MEMKDMIETKRIDAENHRIGMETARSDRSRYSDPSRLHYVCVKCGSHEAGEYTMTPSTILGRLEPTAPSEYICGDCRTSVPIAQLSPGDQIIANGQLWEITWSGPSGPKMWAIFAVVIARPTERDPEGEPHMARMLRTNHLKRVGHNPRADKPTSKPETSRNIPFGFAD